MGKIPVMGLGTSSDPPADFETAKGAMVEAIRVGYRHFDTAAAYGSESHVGAAVKEALSLGLIASRDELFITTKLWAACAEPSLVIPSLKASLENLGMEYVDLYLIHWPIKVRKGVTSFPVEKKDVEPLDIKSLWESMEECQKLGLAKAIGVSNFSIRMLSELLSTANIPPAVNQVEMSVGWQQKKLREYCEAKSIAIMAYSPTGASGTKWGDYSIIGSEIIQRIALGKGKTPAQIALRWVYEQGVSLVVKSFNKERMTQNLDIFDWCLTEEELDEISQFPQRKLVTFASIVGPHDLVLRIDSEL